MSLPPNVSCRHVRSCSETGAAAGERAMKKGDFTSFFFAVVISVDVSLFCCVVITAVSVVVSSAAQVDMEDDAIIRDNITTKNLFSVL